MKSERNRVVEEIASFLIGLIAGAVCGAMFLSFGAALGRSGTAIVDSVWLGLIYGGLVGLLILPTTYSLLIRRIGVRIIGPPEIIVTATAGFFIGVSLALEPKRVPDIRG